MQAVANCAVETQRTVVGRIVSTAEAKSIFAPGNTAGIEIAAERFDPPGAGLAVSVVDRVHVVNERCQIAGIDETILIGRRGGGSLCFFFRRGCLRPSWLQLRKHEHYKSDASFALLALPDHGANRCSNGVDLSAHSRLPRIVTG